jgi:hypothetical protein
MNPSNVFVIALCVFEELNEFVRRLSGNLVIDDHLRNSAAQWLFVEFTTAGTRKIARLKPTDRLINLCAALETAGLEEYRIERPAGSQCPNGISRSSIEPFLNERIIELVHDNQAALVSS